MADVFEDEHERVIAGRARTLFERLETPDAFEYGHPDDPASEVFEAWEETFPSEEAFEERLDRADVTRAECERAMDVVALAPDAELPAWMDRLEELVAAVQSRDPSDVSAASMAPDEDGERPFGELTAALATHVRGELPDDPVRDVLSDRALDSVAEWFRRRFDARFVRILYVEFKSFVASHDRDLAFADPGEFDDPPTEYYERFVEYLFSGGFADVCGEYPMFARLLTTQVRQFHDHLEEFCTRLRADRERLAERFADGELGSVAELEPLADDTHGDGRAIMRVAFESGTTVAYKPRSVDAGVAFHRTLERLDDHLPVPAFRTPTYLSRDGYGWMEWIPPDGCEDEAAVDRYYRRAGSLLCLAYLLEFSDCHFENLVVAGEHPVLVDAETIFHPYFDSGRQPARTGPSALVERSVLLTALVPFGVGDAYADEVDRTTEAIAGFAVSSADATIDAVSRPRIEAANTDVLAVEYEPATIDRSGNVPSVDGTDRPPAEHLDAILDGFRGTYETVLDLRDDGRLSDLLALDDAFAGIENRVVYRPTMRYAAVLRELTSRDRLRDGARFGVGIEELTVPFCTGRVDDPPWSLYDAERDAIRRLDPPRFTAAPDGTTVRIGDRRLAAEADEPGLQRARRRVADASRSDMREQLEFLRGCFGVRPAPDDGSDATGADERVAVSDRRLRDEARALFRDVRDAALETDDGTYHWASLSPWAETERLTIRPADESLLIGRCGIALLGAGLYRLTGDSEYRAFALDAVRPAREYVRDDRDCPALTSTGGTVGLGGVAYGLATVGDLVDEASLADDAVRVADYLTDDVLDADDTYDVSLGAAGTILGFLGAADRTGASELVAAAARCGDHLLSNRTTTGDGVPVWYTIDGSSPLTGFAHGIAGISYALARLSAATGNDEYRTVALEALDFEATAYSETHRNWPDYREWVSEAYLDQWCYGRSGIGLARLGTAAYVTDPRVERGIERAVAAAPETGVGEFDHLCCGNAGRAEFLLAAERRRGRLDGAARELLGGTLARAEATGSYRTLAGTDELADPTLFHGCAGIGYTMLRAVAPDELPSVLLWE